MILSFTSRRFTRGNGEFICFIDSASRRNGLLESVKGVDGFKKIKGVKRHLIVDSQGNILHVHTTCANISDNRTCVEMIADTKRKYPSLKEIRADKGYRGEDVARTVRAQGLIITCTESNAGGAMKVTSVRRFWAYFARSHQSRCPHRSFFDSQNPLKNRRPYDPEILRNTLLSLKRFVCFKKMF